MKQKLFSIIILSIIILLAKPAKSQDMWEFRELYLGTGYNVAFIDFEVTNRILDHFDINTTDIDAGFKKMRNPNGLMGELGIHVGTFTFNTGFNIKSRKRYSSYLVDNTLHQRDIKINTNSFNIGTGLFFQSTYSFGFGLDVNAEYNMIRAKTRAALKSSIGNAEYDTPIKENIWGVSFGPKFYFGDMEGVGSKLMIKPYYNWVLGSVPLNALDNEINADSGGVSGNMNESLSHFGLKIIVTYSVVNPF